MEDGAQEWLEVGRRSGSKYGNITPRPITTPIQVDVRICENIGAKSCAVRNAMKLRRRP